MDLTGQYRIAAAKDAVWEALNDPGVLKRAIPGCREIQKLSDEEMTGAVQVKVGPVKTVLKGWVLVSNIDRPNSYRITGEGTGSAGVAKGSAHVWLVDDEGGTNIGYELKAEFAGKLAELGARTIDAGAKKLADDFFAALSAIVGGHDVIRPPAGVPAQHSEPGMPVVEDMGEEASQFARDVEERVEVAAGQGFLGGPYVWSLAILIVVTLLIAFLR